VARRRQHSWWKSAKILPSGVYPPASRWVGIYPTDTTIEDLCEIVPQRTRTSKSQGQELFLIVRANDVKSLPQRLKCGYFHEIDGQN
jgi:hypothetical protein